MHNSKWKGIEDHRAEAATSTATKAIVVRGAAAANATELRTKAITGRDAATAVAAELRNKVQLGDYRPGKVV